MSRYRKKPVVIEAVQFDGGNLAQIFEELGDLKHGRGLRYDGDDLLVHTLEGDMRATPGDFIIKGVQDEVYPCKPDIFEATYEPVADTATAGGPS
tara:strand:+ start:303 stop:587 length:285 start_codon:yes stop_codon:yes gene_type:complete